MGFFSKGLNNEFETTVANEPSVFEQLKFYCICKTVANISVKLGTFIEKAGHKNTGVAHFSG